MIDPVCSNRKYDIAEELLVAGRIDIFEEFAIKSAKQREGILEILINSAGFSQQGGVISFLKPFSSPSNPPNSTANDDSQH
jgi:hypothetical protein